jgi:hypothetical protein
MRVIYAGSEVLANFLESIAAPGFEVVALGQELDSDKIESLFIVLNFAQFNRGYATDAIMANSHKFSPECEAKIIVV